MKISSGFFISLLCIGIGMTLKGVNTSFMKALQDPYYVIGMILIVISQIGIFRSK